MGASDDGALAGGEERDGVKTYLRWEGAGE
jgi:hypothetical protein